MICVKEDVIVHVKAALAYLVALRVYKIATIFYTVGVSARMVVTASCTAPTVFYMYPFEPVSKCEVFFQINF